MVTKKAYKIREIYKDIESLYVGYGITIPKDIASDFLNTPMFISVSGNRIVLEKSGGVIICE